VFVCEYLLEKDERDVRENDNGEKETISNLWNNHWKQLSIHTTSLLVHTGLVMDLLGQTFGAHYGSKVGGALGAHCGSKVGGALGASEKVSRPVELPPNSSARDLLNLAMSVLPHSK